VMEKFDFLVRYWELRARYETLDNSLGPSERIELLSLLQLFSSIPPDAKQSTASTFARRGVPVQLTAGSGFLAADLKDVSSDRLVVCAAERLPPGRRTIVYIADALTGVEYAVPCTVAWSREDEPCLISLAPDGIPTRSHFTVPIVGLFRSPLGIGPAGHRVEA
jgi:hypothetical protein